MFRLHLYNYSIGRSPQNITNFFHLYMRKIASIELCCQTPDCVN